MDTHAHAAKTTVRDYACTASGVMVTIALCTILWGWPEIAIPAQARAGLKFGLAMGAPSGVALWLAYWLCDAFLARVGRGADSASECDAAIECGEERRVPPALELPVERTQRRFTFRVERPQADS